MSETTKIFDNITSTVRDDLVQTIEPHSKIAVAAAFFSIYAYEALKKELKTIDEFRFIFTSPTFTTEKSKKAQREFYIPRLSRERGIAGTEYEVRLRNELTQKAIAQECAEWIRKKARFRSNRTQRNMSGFLAVQNQEELFVYSQFQEFTSPGLGCSTGGQLGTLVTRFGAPTSQAFIQMFDELWSNQKLFQDVTEEVIEGITAVYQENPAELVYFLALYNIFNEFLEDISEDDLPNERIGFRETLIWKKLFSFQRDAALSIIHKLEQYNGCILADSVGLGKTYTALAVIKYYEMRNKSVLVLCPKKLNENWRTYNANVKNNPLFGDRFRYDVLFHTDLSRTSGESNGLPLDRINWENYDLLVIDESHNFRNGGDHIGEDQRENRYLRLRNRVIAKGVQTKVLMLSATPVNNRFVDLRNQIALAYEGKPEKINPLLKTDTDIDTIFRQAQKAFNDWNKLPPEHQTTENLLHRLHFDFFEMLDSVTIARSRKHIQKFYNESEIGKFPERLPPQSYRPALTNQTQAINYDEIYNQLISLNLSIYTPSVFIFKSREAKYKDLLVNKFGVMGRERGLQRLMSINLLKRLESSIHSFRLTLERVGNYIDSTIEKLNQYQSGAGSNPSVEKLDPNQDEFDLDDQNTEFFSASRRYHIDYADMDTLRWQSDLYEDSQKIQSLLAQIRSIDATRDGKLQQVKNLIREKIRHPLQAENKKVLLFTAFSDTADYLYEHLSDWAKKEFGIHTGLVTGSNGKTTIPRFQAATDRILTVFSPISKEKTLTMPDDQNEIDLLIATDCVSEGQNLQDCDYLINYDIHWNPVRIIQRFGRIDRIGSVNSKIQLVNFWPDIELDEYINLKTRVETRMKISVLTASGDDDVINPLEKGDLAYRRQQLERLQKEIVDLEEMSNGISITDLGLNEFRMDLHGYKKTHPNMDQVPNGIHAVVYGSTPGVLFLLKSNDSAKKKRQNRIHPFYLLFVGLDGNIRWNEHQPKETLDFFRSLAIDGKEPDADACRQFNQMTKDGRNMEVVSELLSRGIASMLDTQEQSAIESLFSEGKTAFLEPEFSGLDDFELICFLAVMAK